MKTDGVSFALDVPEYTKAEIRERLGEISACILDSHDFQRQLKQWRQEFLNRDFETTSRWVKKVFDRIERRKKKRKAKLKRRSGLMSAKEIELFHRKNPDKKLVLTQKEWNSLNASYRRKN